MHESILLSHTFTSISLPVITTDKCEIAFEILFFSLRESAEFGQLRKLTEILVLILGELEFVLQLPRQ